MYVPLKRAVIAALYNYEEATFSQIVSFITNIYENTNLLVDYYDEEEIQVILGTMSLLGYVKNGNGKYSLLKEKVSEKYFKNFISPILNAFNTSRG